jgi:excisionase family DNA binding protein
MSKEILPNAIYTTEEAETLLKVSNSTMKRLLKKGILRANKVGRQYRIMGWEILRLISPKLNKKANVAYLNFKKKAVEEISKW